MNQDKIRIIKKKDITGFLETLLQEYELFAPVKRKGIIGFEAVDSADKVILDYANTVNSAKEAILPQAEVLLSYTSNGDSGGVSVPLDKAKTRVIFGIRPCDARSVVFLDKVFTNGNSQDPYYQSRRKDMVLVSIGCSKPRMTCFCTSVGGSPMSTEGSDLMLVDIGDEYAVQVITEKGEKLLAKGNFSDADEEQLSRMRKTIADAEKTIEPEISVEGLKDKLDALFNDPIWDSLTEKCLSCGVCTFLCPTCYCFDIVDETNKEKGKRIRIWDSCQFPLFTLQASGVNPRPTSKERYRQRIMHKFSYCLDNYGELGCVGCGRCVSQCPVNLDIRTVLKEIQRA